MFIGCMFTGRICVVLGAYGLFNVCRTFGATGFIVVGIGVAGLSPGLMLDLGLFTVGNDTAILKSPSLKTLLIVYLSRSLSLLLTSMLDSLILSS
jgi:hypothetical protein